METLKLILMIIGLLTIGAIVAIVVAIAVGIIAAIVCGIFGEGDAWEDWDEKEGL